MTFGDFKIHVCKFSLKPDSNRICFAEILSEFCRSWRESQIIAGSQCISINFYILLKKRGNFANLAGKKGWQAGTPKNDSPLRRVENAPHKQPR